MLLISYYSVSLSAVSLSSRRAQRIPFSTLYPIELNVSLLLPLSPCWVIEGSQGELSSASLSYILTKLSVRPLCCSMFTDGMHGDLRLVSAFRWIWLPHLIAAGISHRQSVHGVVYFKGFVLNPPVFLSVATFAFHGCSLGFACNFIICDVLISWSCCWSAAGNPSLGLLLKQGSTCFISLDQSI